MGLDFTALDNIPAQGAKDTTPEAPGGAVYGLEREAQERTNARQMYGTYQQNIKRAGRLRSDILKGLRSGEDPLAILLKALECISLMTGDTMIYTQSKADLLAIYGWGLEQPAPLELELEEAKTRLAMLTRPDLATDRLPLDTRERIQRAVTAHREQIERLEQALGGGSARKTDPAKV